MLKNYFTIAWRTIKKNRAFSFINVLGLTIGLVSCMLVATVVMNDLSYDRFWEDSNKIYRVVSVDKMGSDLYNRSEYSYSGISNRLRSDFPEVVTAAKIQSYQETLCPDKRFPNGTQVMLLEADTTIWKMFDFTIQEGNPEQYVNGTKNIVITESFRQTHFPKENPIGKIITNVNAYSDEKTEYLITGVIKDIPANSVLQADVLLVTKPGNHDIVRKEARGMNVNYVLFKKGIDINDFTKRFNDWYAATDPMKRNTSIEFQALPNIYLHSEFAKAQEVKGSLTNVYIFAGVAILLLVIACINYVNLSTARAINRLKETGVRKILGADRKQIIQQFLTESFLFFFIATVLATLIYFIGIPLVEQFLDYRIAKTLLSQTSLLIISYSVILLISFLAGIYPALVISAFKPSTVIKGKSKENLLLRKSLVVLQFSISIIVLIGLLVVRHQVGFMNKKDLGFDKNNLISSGFASFGKQGNSFKQELLKNTAIESVAISRWTPTKGAGSMSRQIDVPGTTNEKIKVNYILGDIDLAATLKLQLQRGRLLDKSYSSDLGNQDEMMSMDSTSYSQASLQQTTLVTAYTAQLLQMEVGIPNKNVLTTPAGIVNNFHNESLKTPLGPTILMAEREVEYGNLLVRTQPGLEKQAVAHIEKTWNSFYSGRLLDIKWVDDMVEKQYQSEKKLQGLLLFFGGLSMFLAALGIFGLITQSLAQRVKEIGIRKVLGAPIASIVNLFTMDVLKMVFIAVLIASPIAWWLMNNWLSNFAFRITIGWEVFLIACGIAVCITLVTVSYQAIKAAIANPIKSLRTE